MVNHSIFHFELDGRRPSSANQKSLEKQGTCTNAQDDCKACAAWWVQQTLIHRALKLPPHFWPALPEPNATLDAALTAT